MYQQSSHQKAATPGPLGSQGARRASGEPRGPGQTPSPDADPQVKQPVVRRHFTNSKKLKILAEVARLRSEGNGQMGAYLRRHGLYYATVQRWQAKADAGQLGASKGRAKAQKSRDSVARENKALRRKLEQMEKKLAKQEIIIDLQKKLSDMLQMEEELNACDKRH